MVTAARPNLRADAARNVERIVSSAEAVFARAGSAASMADVATEAGVGVATVYRRFAGKETLLQAVLERRFDEVVVSGLREAASEADPRAAMRRALEAALSFVADDPNMVSAASSYGLMTMDLAYRFFEAAADILRRGQDGGVFRADLVAEDVPRIVLMLVGTLVSFEPGSLGWHRYLDLMLDSLSATQNELTDPTPVRDHRPPLSTLAV
jgi:AcrR family transcriptional regulator